MRLQRDDIWLVLWIVFGLIWVAVAVDAWYHDEKGIMMHAIVLIVLSIERIDSHHTKRR